MVDQTCCALMGALLGDVCFAKALKEIRLDLKSGELQVHLRFVDHSNFVWT